LVDDGMDSQKAGIPTDPTPAMIDQPIRHPTRTFRRRPVCHADGYQ